MNTMTISATSRDERRLTASVDLEVRDTGSETGAYTIRGHAAVFNAMSEDLGGFRELIAPGAFSDVLRTSPDVVALVNHDPNLVLGRTISGTLELREDQVGLRVWASAPKGVSYVQDLRLLMQRGDLHQMSFGFRIAPDGDTWSVAEDGTIVRTITRVGELFDVSVVTMPAYRQTDADIRSVLDRAVERGLVPPGAGLDLSAVPGAGAGEESSSAVPEQGAGGESSAPEARRLVDERRRRLRRLTLPRD